MTAINSLFLTDENLVKGMSGTVVYFQGVLGYIPVPVNGKWKGLFCYQNVL